MKKLLVFVILMAGIANEGSAAKGCEDKRQLLLKMVTSTTSSLIDSSSRPLVIERVEIGTGPVDSFDRVEIVDSSIIANGILGKWVSSLGLMPPVISNSTGSLVAGSTFVSPTAGLAPTRVDGPWFPANSGTAVLSNARTPAFIWYCLQNE